MSEMYLVVILEPYKCPTRRCRKISNIAVIGKVIQHFETPQDFPHGPFSLYSLLNIVL